MCLQNILLFVSKIGVFGHFLEIASLDFANFAYNDRQEWHLAEPCSSSFQKKYLRLLWRYFAYWLSQYMKKCRFFNFKIFQIFLYCKFSQFKLFSIICKKPQKTAGPKKIYFAFWRPSICEKWHFFDLKIFQILLYCKFSQFKLFFSICKKP